MRCASTAASRPATSSPVPHANAAAKAYSTTLPDNQAIDASGSGREREREREVAKSYETRMDESGIRQVDK